VIQAREDLGSGFEKLGSGFDTEVGDPDRLAPDSDRPDFHVRSHRFDGTARRVNSSSDG